MPDSCPLVDPASALSLSPSPPVPARPLLRVLVVDDHPLMARSLCRALRAHGIHAVPALSVESALRLVSSEPAFDAIVTDLGLPGVSGQELARRLRQPRLVALSGDGEALRHARLFDARLAKPCATPVLVAALRG